MSCLEQKNVYSKIWRPFTQMKIARQHIKVEQASGATLTLEDGTELIDAISSWWVITHGHCHPKIAEAIAKQASKVDQVLFANFSNKCLGRPCRQIK